MNFSCIILHQPFSEFMHIPLPYLLSSIHEFGITIKELMEGFKLMKPKAPIDKSFEKFQRIVPHIKPPESFFKRE